MDNEKKYLSVKEAMRVSGLSYTTLRKKIKSGELRATRPSWKLVIERQDLDAFMQKDAYKVKAG